MVFCLGFNGHSLFWYGCRKWASFPWAHGGVVRMLILFSALPRLYCVAFVVRSFYLWPKDASEMQGSEVPGRYQFSLSLSFEKGKFQLRSALSGNSITYSTIILHSYLHLKLVWKCEYENDILHIYKRKDFIGKEGEQLRGGNSNIDQNFLSFRGKSSDICIKSCFLWNIWMPVVNTKTFTMTLIAQDLYLNGYKQFDWMLLCSGSSLSCCGCFRKSTRRGWVCIAAFPGSSQLLVVYGLWDLDL